MGLSVVTHRTPPFENKLYIFVKYCLIRNRYLESLKRSSYHLLADLLRVSLALCRVAQRIRNSYAGDDPVRSDCPGDRNNCRHMYDRYAVFLDTLNHRCTATRTGTSCADEDDSVYVFLYEFLSDRIAEFGGGACGCTGSRSSAEVVHQLAEFSLLLQLAQDVKRYDKIRILHDELSVVTAVDGGEILR